MPAEASRSAAVYAALVLPAVAFRTCAVTSVI